MENKTQVCVWRKHSMKGTENMSSMRNKYLHYTYCGQRWSKHRGCWQWFRSRIRQHTLCWWWLEGPHSWEQQ